jgi:hypothetical protein
MDGIFPVQVRKCDPWGLRLLGSAILTSDQTLTPIAVVIRVEPLVTQISGIEIAVGTAGGGPLGISGPKPNSKKRVELAYALLDESSTLPIAWVYEVVWP